MSQGLSGECVFTEVMQRTTPSQHPWVLFLFCFVSSLSRSRSPPSAVHTWADANASTCAGSVPDAPFFWKFLGCRIWSSEMEHFSCKQPFFFESEGKKLRVDFASRADGIRRAGVVSVQQHQRNTHVGFTLARSLLLIFEAGSGHGQV